MNPALHGSRAVTSGEVRGPALVPGTPQHNRPQEAAAEVLMLVGATAPGAAGGGSFLL